MQTNIDELRYAYCANPFETLGVIPNDRGGATVTCWLPGAESVELLSWHSQEKGAECLGQMAQIDNDGFFQTTVSPYKGERFRYRVRYRKATSTKSGSGSLSKEPVADTVIKLDPYQFPDLRFNNSFYDACRVYYHEGAHLVQTSIEGEDVHGVRFSVYAPNARAISVIGDFNHWDGRVHPMQSSEDGVWRLFIPNVEIGQGYKYEIKNRHGDVLPHKIDPFAFSVDQFPSFASRVYDHSYYQWRDQDWQNRAVSDYRQQPINVYEVHLGSWRHDNGRPLTYRQLTEQLIPYVVDMGYTHIELMPISEYPFDGSWGYQPVGLFAPTSRFGPPDDFKAFVDACHQHSIGVLLDWVPAHFPTDAHGLADFDGSKLYEYEDPKKGWHQDWNSLIYDYGREHVCRFLISNAIYWFEMFHIDGVRVDAVASMLYLDYAREDGEWIPNIDGGNENYEAISFIKRLNETIYLNYPNAMTVAEESTAFPGVSKPTFEGGLGFGFKWNMGWMNDSLRYIAKDHIHRKHHHGELTFSMVYAFDEHFVLPLSHDEVVHGKCSLLDKMPGDGWQKFANLRAFAGYMFAHPGKKLNFMGNEIAQGREWNYLQSLDWHLLDDTPYHRGQQALIKSLSHLYKQESSLYHHDYSGEGFCWLVVDDSENSVLAFARFAADRSEHIVALMNLTPVPREGYRIGVPAAGSYTLLINTDDTYFGGSGYSIEASYTTENQPTHGQAQSIQCNIPPLSAVWLKYKPTSL